MSDTGTMHGRLNLRASAGFAAVAALSLALASCGRQIDGDCTSPEIVEKAKTNMETVDFDSRLHVVASLASIDKFIKSSETLGFAQAALMDFASKNRSTLTKIRDERPATYAMLALDPDRIDTMNALADRDSKRANEAILMALAGDSAARTLFQQMIADTAFCKRDTKCPSILQGVLDKSVKDIVRLQDEIRALKPRFGIFQIEVASFDKPAQKLVCDSFVSVKFEGEDLEEKLRIRYVVEKPSRQELRVTVGVIK